MSALALAQEARVLEYRAFGTMVTAGPDVDGDGVADAIVIDPLGRDDPRGRYGYEGRSSVWCLSGGSGRTLWRSDEGATEEGFGHALIGGILADVDATTDVAMVRGRGGLTLFSGRDGKLAHREPASGFPMTLSDAIARSSVDAHGVASEVVIGLAGAFESSEAPLVVEYSTARHAIVRIVRVRLEARSGAFHVNALARIGDCDGDGRNELAVSLAGELGRRAYGDRVLVLSGADPSRVLADLEAPGIGCSDLASCAPSERGGAFLVGGIGRVVRYRCALPPVPECTWNGSSDEKFGWRVLELDDFDGDGPRETAIASFDAGVWSGAVACFSGAELREVRRIEGDEDTHHLGTSFAAVGDADGDGIADLVVGADHSESYGSSSVRLVSARTGGLLWRVERVADDRCATFTSERSSR